MTIEQRTEAATAFWQDRESPEIALQHAEAAGILATRLKFRVKSIYGLPVERRARQLAQVSDVSESIATRALIAWHFAARRPLMAAFLDALGIEHEDGLISADDVATPSAEAIRDGAASLRTRFDAADVDLYLKTLSALDGDTWANVDSALASPAA